MYYDTVPGNVAKTTEINKVANVFGCSVHITFVYLARPFLSIIDSRGIDVCRIEPYLLFTLRRMLPTIPLQIVCATIDQYPQQKGEDPSICFVRCFEMLCFLIPELVVHKCYNGGEDTTDQ